MPRPSKLTKTAQAAGIAPDTLRAWMRQGEQQAAGRYKTLARTVEQAEASAEIEGAREIPKAWQRGERRAAVPGRYTTTDSVHRPQTGVAMPVGERFIMIGRTH